jgi:hypothetical protein
MIYSDKPRTLDYEIAACFGSSAAHRSGSRKREYTMAIARHADVR